MSDSTNVVGRLANMKQFVCRFFRRTGLRRPPLATTRWGALSESSTNSIHPRLVDILSTSPTIWLVNLTSLTYPSGRAVNFTYSSASLPTKATFSSMNGSTIGYDYLSSVTYAPDGAPLRPWCSAMA